MDLLLAKTEKMFVHQSDVLMNGFRFIEAGQKVCYWVEPTEKGNKAINVIVEE